MDERNDFESPPTPEEFSEEAWSGETLPLAGGIFDGDESAPFETASGGIIPMDATDPPRRADGDRRDARLYLKYSEGWAARIKHDWLKEYCYSQNPGEEYYHLLISGEIYLQRGTEKYCLSCALRHGHVTLDRLHWQRSGARPSEDKQ